MKTHPHVERLLILMSLSHPAEDEIREAEHLADKIASWDDFYELAHINRIDPLVCANLKKLDLYSKLPDAVRQKFEDISESIRQTNESRLEVCRIFLKRFAEKDIPVVILKGVNFAETVYQNPYYRRMNDIDILIKQQSLDDIFDVYEELRFFALTELLGKNPRKQEKYSHHLPSFISRDLKCVVGTHWGLVTPRAPFTIDYDAIWARVKGFDFYGIPVLTMAVEDNLHHLCVHLPYYKAGLKEVADIYNIIRLHGDKIDWNLFLKEVAKAKTESTVYNAFTICHKICPMDIFVEIIQKVKARVPALFKFDVYLKTRHLSLLLRNRCIHLARVERAFNELNATDQASEKRRALSDMWKNLFFPPENDIIRMNFFKKPNRIKVFMGRFTTPWRILRVFARDLGAGILVLVLIKSVVDTIVCTLKSPFKRQTSTQGIEYYAQKLGVTVEGLMMLKESQE